jgi:hypothetical protein
MDLNKHKSVTQMERERERERERLIKNVWTRLYLQRLAKVTRKKQTTTTAIHAMPYRLDKVLDREGARNIYRPND